MYVMRSCIWGWMTSSPFVKKSITYLKANCIDGDHSTKGGVACRRFFYLYPYRAERSDECRSRSAVEAAITGETALRLRTSQRALSSPLRTAMHLRKSAAE